MLRIILMSIFHFISQISHADKLFFPICAFYHRQLLYYIGLGFFLIINQRNPFITIDNSLKIGVYGVS